MNSVSIFLVNGGGMCVTEETVNKTFLFFLCGPQVGKKLKTVVSLPRK